MARNTAAAEATEEDQSRSLLRTTGPGSTLERCDVRQSTTIARRRQLAITAGIGFAACCSGRRPTTTSQQTMPRAAAAAAGFLLAAAAAQRSPRAPRVLSSSLFHYALYIISQCRTSRAPMGPRREVSRERVSRKLLHF